LAILEKHESTAESLFFPSVDDLMELEEHNKSHCFMPVKEEESFGWCATCNPDAKRGEPGFCSDEFEVTNEEIARPGMNKGWGFCSKNCGESIFALKKLMGAQFTVLSDERCQRSGNRIKNGQVVNNVNVKTELCAAFINLLNTTVMNYTKTGADKNKFELFNLEEYKKAKAEATNVNRMFRAQRIKNTEFTEFTNKTDYVMGGMDSCKGDSGGPLTTMGNFTGMNNVTRYNVEVQIGVVSRGKDCAVQNYPGIYGRVKAILRWIRSIADKAHNYTVMEIPGHFQGVNNQPVQVGSTVLVSPYCKKIIRQPIHKEEKITKEERKMKPRKKKKSSKRNGKRKKGKKRKAKKKKH